MDNEAYKISDEDLKNMNSNITFHIDWGDVPGGYFCFGKRTFANFPLSFPVRSSSGRVPDLNGLLLQSYQWLETCTTQHKACDSPADQDTFIPTRLLDLGEQAQPSLRLVLSENLSKSDRIRYVTLSYCWGQGTHATCTTKTNLEERLDVIHLETLPKTLQDAVLITRALSIRYLWIDALCIIQTKPGEHNEDWLRESSNMGKIYRHSVLTIAASGAKNSSEGCFYRRKAASWPAQDFTFLDIVKKKSSPWLGGSLTLGAILPSWNLSVEQSALAKRGWVLQERMLASRTLFWTEDGLFWQCSELHASEFEAAIEFDQFDPQRTFPLLDEVANSLTSENDYPNPHYAWTKVLAEFSTKALTVTTDKLAAVEGLANEVARLTSRTYESGVWRHNLYLELAWSARFRPGLDAKSPATRLPNTPSWLWASTHQTVRFLPEVQVVSYRELAIISAFDGQRLQISGQLGTLQVKRREAYLKPTYGYPLCTFMPATDTPRGWDRDIAVIDTLEDTLPGEGGTIRCLQWMKWKGYVESKGWETIGALILSPIDQKGNVYRRIGWVQVVEACFLEEDLQTITLV